MTLFPGVALITGAASGIGRATAIQFAVESCTRIAIADLNFPGLQETAYLLQTSSPTADFLILEVNMLSETEISSMISKTVEKWGRIDYAVNCAGIMGNQKPSHLTSAEQFDLITGVNYRGCWLSSRGEIAQMLKQEKGESHDGREGARGSVVNIASQLGVVGRPDAPAYCASKAAVIGMTRSDAIDYSKHNIRVNCVCPGIIETRMTQGDEAFKAALQPAIGIAPMNRMGSAKEVAYAVLFLCSSKASFIQGHALVVDGGYVIN